MYSLSPLLVAVSRIQQKKNHNAEYSMMRRLMCYHRMWVVYNQAVGTAELVHPRARLPD